MSEDKSKNPEVAYLHRDEDKSKSGKSSADPCAKKRLHQQNTVLLGNYFYYFSIFGNTFLAYYYLISSLLACE
jgi:hypothetical protein